MSLPTITYKEVAQRVNDYIITNCQNVNNKTIPARDTKVLFAGSNASLKGSWYTYTRANTPATYTISTEAAINDNCFGQFLKEKCGITTTTALGGTVAKSDFINLLIDIGKFCATRVKWYNDFSATPSGTNPTHNTALYLVYTTDAVSGAITLGTGLDYKIVTTTDVTAIIDTIKNNISNTNRCINARYTITFQNSP